MHTVGLSSTRSGKPWRGQGEHEGPTCDLFPHISCERQRVEGPLGGERPRVTLHPKDTTLSANPIGRAASRLRLPGEFERLSQLGE